MAWLAMRVHVGRQRKGGVDVIDVEGEEEAPPAPPARKRKAQPPQPALRCAVGRVRVPMSAGACGGAGIIHYYHHSFHLQHMGQGCVRRLCGGGATTSSRANVLLLGGGTGV